MAILIEDEVFEFAIYLIEITDAVIGGANGIANLQAKQLANRTAWLKANKQDKDATLTALADLIVTADKLIYATGADTFSTTTLTAFARTLLDDTDAATMRATIGAQASDATLTAIAALATAADKLIYATGADTFSTTTLTAFARTLLDDADATAMRTTLGVFDGIGVGQTWQNMTASRVLNTTYTNSSGKPIMVSVMSDYSINADIVGFVDGTAIARSESQSGAGETLQLCVTFIVPNGSTYKATGNTLGGFFELK